MNHLPLLQPKEQPIKLMDGSEKIFIISKFSATAGREIVTQYPLTAAPKIGDYKTNEALMIKILSHVAVPIAGADPLRLGSLDLINNHVPDYEALIRIEWAMMEYNCSFFAKGALSHYLDQFSGKFQALITQMLTQLRAQSPAKD